MPVDTLVASKATHPRMIDCSTQQTAQNTPVVKLPSLNIAAQGARPIDDQARNKAPLHDPSHLIPRNRNSTAQCPCPQQQQAHPSEIERDSSDLGQTRRYTKHTHCCAGFLMMVVTALARYLGEICGQLAFVPKRTAANSIHTVRLPACACRS
jgi:hypothetical protein